MSFNGDLYPTAGADVVMTTKGDMVDYNTARQRLGIGSANQILQVKSGLPSWETLSTAGSVLTTQGDVLYEGASALARLGQSTNFHTLATKGAGANPAWQASATSTMTAAQDVLYSSSANTLARLAAGTDGDVLTTHSTGSAPTWETPSSGLWTQIGNYRATGEEASTSFSSLGVDLDSDYSMVKLIMTGKSVASLNGGFYLNGVSSGAQYIYCTVKNDSTTLSGELLTSQNVINILPSGMVTGADEFFNIELDITYSGDPDQFMYQFRAGVSIEGNIFGAGSANLNGTDELDTINVSFGNSWRAGTQINVYKVGI